MWFCAGCASHPGSMTSSMASKARQQDACSAVGLGRSTAADSPPSVGRGTRHLRQAPSEQDGCPGRPTRMGPNGEASQDADCGQAGTLIPATAPRPVAGPCHRVRSSYPQRQATLYCNPRRDHRTMGPRPRRPGYRRRHLLVRLSIAGGTPRPLTLNQLPTVSSTRMVAGRGI